MTPSTEIHPAAHVDPDADLGEGVRVGPGAVIEAGVVVGDDSRIGPHAVLHRGATLGREVRVHTGVVIGDEPQDLKFQGGESRVEIGDRCVLREYATVHRCTEPGAVTRVGADCFLMAYSHVAHECALGDGVIFANGAALAGHVSVDDGAFLSANALVHQFVRVGRLAMVGGDSKVLRDVPPFCTADGHPARLAGLNSVGLRRAGLSSDVRGALKRAYRTLFRRGMRRSEAIAAALDEEGEVDEVREMVDFLGGSERGIASARQRRA